MQRGVLLVTAFVCFSSSCSGDGKGGTPVLQLKDKAGTCINAGPDLGPEVKKIPTVDCSVPHTHEIYAVIPYFEKTPTGGKKFTDVFPGLEALDAFAERECIAPFELYVGVSAFDSTLTFSWLTPTLASWNGSGKDRDVICVLGKFDSSTLDRSMKDSKE